MPHHGAAVTAAGAAVPPPPVPPAPPTLTGAPLRKAELTARARAANSDTMAEDVSWTSSLQEPAKGVFVGPNKAHAKTYTARLNCKNGSGAHTRAKESRPAIYSTFCKNDPCKYRLTIRYNGVRSARAGEGEEEEEAEDGAGFYITQYVPHKPGCGVGAATLPRVSNASYDQALLASMLIGPVLANPQLSGKSARAAIAASTTAQPGSQVISRALRVAKAEVNGRRQDQPMLLQQLKKECEGDGHTLRILTASVTEQLDMVTKMIADANAATPPRPTEHLQQTVAALHEIQVAQADASFLVGYMFLPEHGPRMFETLLPAVAADAAHMKLGQDTATVYGIWAQDSNKHLICLALMTVYDTENKRMWRTLLLAVKEHYPTFDSDEMVCIADGDKGFHAAFTEVLEKGSPFLCAHHKAGNLKTQKGTQKQDIDLFWGAVMASTLSALQGKIADMSLAAQQYLAKTPPSELYLVHVNGRTGGKSSSQLAETGNSTLEELRRMQLGTGLLAFMQSDFARMGKNASAALAADPDIDPLAPKIRKQLNQKLEHKANTGWPFSARFEANCCIVTSLSDPTKSFTLKLGVPGSCSCGESETYGIACDHEIFAARTNNTNLAALYPAYRTVKNWQATYEAMVSNTCLHLINCLYISYALLN